MGFCMARALSVHTQQNRPGYVVRCLRTRREVLKTKTSLCNVTGNHNSLRLHVARLIPVSSLSLSLSLSGAPRERKSMVRIDP